MGRGAVAVEGLSLALGEGERGVSLSATIGCGGVVADREGDASVTRGATFVSPSGDGSAADADRGPSVAVERLVPVALAFLGFLARSLVG